MNKQRIVITGMGAITPLGIGLPAYWEALVSGTSGVGRVTRFDASEHDVKIAAEVKGFDPGDYMDKREVRRTDRFAQFGIAAALMAVEDSGLVINEHNANRVGVLVGSGIGGLETLEGQMRVLFEKGPARVSPLIIPMMIADNATGQVSILTGAKGPNSTVVTACATGAHAIGDSMEILLRGDADAMICGGTEAAVTPMSLAGFGNMKAMTTKFNDCPTRASRPFERDRDGFVIGEGAGVVILETLESAERRGAKHIYAEVAGYGMSGDAYHLTGVAPGHEGVVRAARAALESAQMPPEAIGYVNAHGTSTPLNDVNETLAFKTIFGDRAKNGLLVSSTKSMTGHLLGGAGAIEAIASALVLTNDAIPPTINYENPDPDCDLDYVPNVARQARVDAVMSNNSGFGGHNAVLIFKRFV